MPVVVPWTDRHRPKHLGEVIGNTDQVRKLAEWLRDWDDVVLHGKVKEQKAPESWQKFVPAPENINARAALVSGPPGIGKTTTCCLVARCNPKFKLLEFNASDARGKTIIDNMSNSLAGNHTLKFGSGGGSAIERAVIIMDECDGMSGGDAGGLQAMKNMIKNTKNPIICICNDRGQPGIRDLAGMCYDIKFRRPENAVVAKRINKIMEGEGRKADLRTIEAVIEACGHDIRQIINQSQFFGSVTAHGKESQKDTQQMLSPFDACEQFLGRRDRVAKPGKQVQKSVEQRLDMFYLDADLMPLMVQENYLRAASGSRGTSSAMERCAQAACLIATGDRMSGNWEVQSSAAIIGTLYPAYLSADESFNRPVFPAWLQKKAPQTKASRLVQEVFSKLRLFTTCASKEFATSSYHDLLYQKMVKPLQYGAVKDCAVALHRSGLSREFFTDQAPALRVPLQLDDMYRKVEGKLKSQLLQELQALVQEASGAMKRRRDVPGGANKTRQSLAAADDQDPDDVGGGKPKRSRTGGQQVGGGLASWRPEKKRPNDGDPGAVATDKASLMIMRYQDGHTCAVRRTVHMKDILEPWLLF